MSKPNNPTLASQFKTARKVSVPLICVTTPDPAATVKLLIDASDKLVSESNGKVPDAPIFVWDVIQGVSAKNDLAKESIHKIVVDGMDPTAGNPSQLLISARQLPAGTILFVHMAHRWIVDASFVQATWNLRDQFKVDGRMLVFLAPSIALPPELAGDVVVLDEPLPDADALAATVREQHNNAGLKADEETVGHAVEALLGLSSFAAEQVTAMCLTKKGVNLPELWERKRKQIEQTPGLSVMARTETFASIGGLSQVKQYMLDLMNGNGRPHAVVWLDEIDKSMPGGSSDSSGVSQDQLGTVLSYMEDNEVLGVLFVGPPGCQPAGSKVLMARGEFIDIENVKVGDVVASPQADGSSINATVLSASRYDNQTITEVRMKGRMQSSYRCSLEHVVPHIRLKAVELRRPEKISVASAGEHRWKNFRRFRRDNSELRELTAASLLERGCRKSRIFTSPAIQFQEANLAVHPYIVGCLLGDGCLTGRGQPTNGLPNFVSNDSEIVEEMKRHGCTFGKSGAKQGTTALSYNIVGEMAHACRRLSVWGRDSFSKFIPNEYKISSLEQRLWLLAGLIDTDGDAESLSTVSRQLADDFTWIVQSVGGTARVAKKISTCRGKQFPSWRINFSFCEHRPPIQLARKRMAPRNMVWKNPRNRAFTVSRTGEKNTVYGFTIDSPSQWYITDNWIVTHNSGKSAIAKTTGNNVGAPTIRFDLGACKGSLVGQSESRIRDALKAITAVANGKSLFIATANSVAGLDSALKRRFPFIFYFDLPTREEKDAIWKVWMKRYSLTGERPADEGWSGANIQKCCECAWRLNRSLADCHRYVVPCARVSGKEIEALRNQANGVFLSASDEGAYRIEQPTTERGQQRKVTIDR